MGKIEVSTHYICVGCGRQFIDVYAAPQGYSDDVKATCLKMYVNGMGFRGIERVTGVHHTERDLLGKTSRRKPAQCKRTPDSIPEVGELDELETFIGSKKTKSGRQ